MDSIPAWVEQLCGRDAKTAYRALLAIEEMENERADVR